MGQRRGKKIHNYGLESRMENVVRNQEARAERTPQQQLKVLDERLGDGKGAAKERAKLQKQIEEAKKPKAEPKEKPEVKEDAEPKPKLKAKERHAQEKKK